MRTAAGMFALALAGGLAAPPAASGREGAVACAGGRFEAAAGGDLPLGVVLEFEGDTVTIVPECPPLAAVVRAERRATRIRARAATCPGLGQRLGLRARIEAPGCTAMRGRLRIGPRRGRFTAARVATLPPVEPAKPPLTTGCRAGMGPEECRAHAGDYEAGGLSPAPLCRCRTQDAGTVCRRALDCQGMCIAPLGETSAGRCSEHVAEFGCFTVFDDTGTPQGLCFD